MQKAPPQHFFPSIGGQQPDRDVHNQSDPETAKPAGAVADEVAGNPQYTIPVAPPKIFGINQIVVPAGADRLPINLPDANLGWISFYCPTVPAATLTVGPNAPTIDLTTAGWLTLPVTTRQYLLRNTAATAYTLTYAYGAGYPPMDSEFWGSGGGSVTVPSAAVSIFGKNVTPGDTAITATPTGRLEVSFGTAQALGDASANGVAMFVDDGGSQRILGVGPMLYNGASTDRQRNNNEVTALASAARTTAIDSADLVNYNARGVIVVVDITAITAACALTITIQGKDTLSSKYYPLLVSAVLAAVGTFVLTVYPGTTAAANTISNSPLPRIWRVDVAVGNANSQTYSVGANFIN